MVRDKEFQAVRAYFGSSLWTMLGLKAARLLYKLKKWSGIRDLKLLEPFLAHLFGRCSGLRLRETSLQAKKVVRDKELEAFRSYFGSSLWKMLGFEAARLLYKLKKWSGIRNLRLLEPILAHLCGRCSGLRLRDLSTS